MKEPLPTGAAILMSSAAPAAHEKVNAVGLRSELTDTTAAPPGVLGVRPLKAGRRESLSLQSVQSGTAATRWRRHESFRSKRLLLTFTSAGMLLFCVLENNFRRTSPAWIRLEEPVLEDRSRTAVPNPRLTGRYRSVGPSVPGRQKE